MRALASLAIGLAVAACGGGGAPAPAHAPAPRLPSIEARPAAPDDPIVAKVDGRPIYGSCVAAQARAHREDARHALDDCIGLELLAGVAAQRGLDRDPDVVDGYRRALVDRLVERDFADKYRTAADLPPDLVEPVFAKAKWRMHRPEYRFSVYVRAPLGAKATPADDAAAHAFMQEVYARLQDRHDLFPIDLFRAAEEVARGRTFEKLTEPFGSGREGPGDVAYTHPLFDLHAIGEVTPPVRTPWGWDVILWTDTMPPKESSRDEVLAWLFPNLRADLLERWVDDLIKDQGIAIVVEEKTMERRYGGK